MAKRIVEILSPPGSLSF